MKTMNKIIATSSVSLAIALALLIPQLASATIYQPGETLEPNCGPTDPNCGVATLSSSLGTTTSIGNSLLTIQATSTNSVLETLRAFPGQTANLFQVQDSTGANIFAINASGVAQFLNSFTLGSFNGPLQANNGVVSATSSLGVVYGGTGLTTAPSLGDILVGNSAGGYTRTATSSLGLSTTDVAEGTNLYFTNNRLASALAGTTTSAIAEGTNLYFTTARADSNFATNLAATTTSALAEGTNLYFTNDRLASALAATTTSALAEGTNLYFTNARASTTFATIFAATTTSALAEGTNLYFTTARANSNFATNLAATTTSALAEGTNLYFTNNRVASVFAGTTTSALAEGTNLYFTNDRVASVIAGTTTDALAQGVTNRYYSDTFVQNFVNASTTIAKTYSANVFTAANIFNGATTLGTLNGPLQANNGLVSATSSIGTLYGGTGLSSTPAFGQILRGTGTGYALVSTSPLGIDLADTIGSLGVSRGGTGATTFGQGWIFSTGDGNPLAASTSPTVNYIIATSTTATSTFAGGIAIGGGGLKIGTLPSCTTLTTDGSGNVGCTGATASTSVIIKKPADQATTTNVLANDTDLAFNIAANETWVFRFDLLYTTAGTPDFQVAVTAPSGATCDYAASELLNGVSTGTSVCGNSLQFVGGAVASDTPLPLFGSVTNGGTPGVVHLQFAQVTAGGQNTAVQRGSSLAAFHITNGADLAEVYYSKDMSLVPGTVVALDSSLPGGVQRSLAHDKKVIGIVSTKPGVLIGDTIGAGDGVPVLVALAGRVPVQVVAENGAIEPGDYLTPSSEPGAAMKSTGQGPVIGQAIGGYGDEGVGVILAFVKNFDMNGSSALLGDSTSASTTIATVQSETIHDPMAIFTKKITDGTQFLTDFVAARVTAIRGYFDEIFARKAHVEELCVKKSDGTEVCVNGDQVNSLLENAHINPVTNPISDDNSSGNPGPAPSSTPPVIDLPDQSGSSTTPPTDDDSTSTPAQTPDDTQSDTPPTPPPADDTAPSDVPTP